MTTARRTMLSSCSPTRHPAAAVVQDASWNGSGSALCHSSRARPARRRRQSTTQNSSRRRSTTPWMSGPSWVVIVLFSILICCQRAEAGTLHGPRRIARKSGLVFDKRVAPEPRMRLNGRKEHHGPHEHGEKKSSNDTIKTNPSSSQLSLPHPFDTSLGNNFTASSCPAFFDSFLNSDSFNNCLPFSLLLQTSSGFFAATQSPPRLTQTLDATCNVNYKQCSLVMSNLALEIQKDTNCGADFQLGNPQVTQAYTGLVAYQPSYNAGCLKDTHGDYCFQNAVMNASAPSSSYVYYLPLGVSLPGGTQPTCDSCLQNTMRTFATYAANSSQPLSTDYSAAAEQVDMICGPRFADSASVQTGAAASIHSAVGGLSVVTVAALLSALLF